MVGGSAVTPAACVQLDKMAGGGGAHAKKAGMVSKLLGMCTGGNSTVRSCNNIA